jgi:hypothetical protein
MRLADPPFSYTGTIRVVDTESTSTLGYISATSNSLGEYGLLVSVGWRWRLVPSYSPNRLETCYLIGPCETGIAADTFLLLAEHGRRSRGFVRGHQLGCVSGGLYHRDGSAALRLPVPVQR